MRGMEPIDETLRATVDAAGRYLVPEGMVAEAAQALIEMGDSARRRAEILALHDALLAVADRHAGPHDNCDTCRAVRNGLAVALGVVRAEIAAEFERRL